MRSDGLESFRLFLAFRTFIRHPSKFTVQPMRTLCFHLKLCLRQDRWTRRRGRAPALKHGVDARIILPLHHQIDRSLLNHSVLYTPVQRGQISRRVYQRRPARLLT